MRDGEGGGLEGVPGGGVFEGFGEEAVDFAVEVFGLVHEGAVAGVGDYRELGVRDVLVDEDGVGDGDEVVVAADDERGGLDGVELGEGDVGFLPVEEEDFAVVVFFGGGVGFVEAGVVLFFLVVPEAGAKASAVGQRLAPVEARRMTLSGWRMARRRALMPPSDQPMT